MMRFGVFRLLVFLPLLACGAREVPPTLEPTVEPASSTSSEAASSAPTPSARDLWWQHLQDLCGQAFPGALVSADEADAALQDQPMVMHVRRCEEGRLEIPFVIGENRSRTWVLTRTAEGIHLQHDHRHEDGSPDVVTLYGGRTAEEGTAGSQSFPADSYSVELFQANGLEASVTNVWTMEIEPGERFSYILRRPQRYFRADFDLAETVPPPPVPWGHEEVGSEGG